MIIQDQASALAAGERSGVDSDRGPSWGARSDGQVALAYEYMDEEIEEAMILIDSPASMSPAPLGPPGHDGRD